MRTVLRVCPNGLFVEADAELARSKPEAEQQIMIAEEGESPKDVGR
jgi:hypothetical protein